LGLRDGCGEASRSYRVPPVCGTDTNTDGHAYCHHNAFVHALPEFYTNAHGKRDAHADPNSNCHPHSDPNADPDSSTDPPSRDLVL
jgi:hypothetical protein